MATLLKLPASCAKINIAKATVYDWTNPDSPRFDPTFPQPVKIGGSVFFVEQELDDWIAAKIAARDELLTNPAKREADTARRKTIAARLQSKPSTPVTKTSKSRKA